jgi:hypothetical protein
LLEQINARSIFSPATGFIARGGFDWTCNPYVGCTFGCIYCYAMFLPQNRRPREDWGRWFTAKANAIELAQRHGPKVAGKAVYLSSVTDPYLPAERGLRLTRGILEALIPHQPRLLIQTRGPLVVRDLDLLRQFRAVRVNLSIPTDSETVRLAFEPKAPPGSRRQRPFVRGADDEWRALDGGGGAVGGRGGRPLRDADAAVGRRGRLCCAADGVRAGRAGDAGLSRQRRRLRRRHRHGGAASVNGATLDGGGLWPRRGEATGAARGL